MSNPSIVLSNSADREALSDPLQAFRLDGRVVVLTGASSGLGVGFARTMAAVGADLVLAARRVEPLESLATELRNAGIRVMTQSADVSQPDDCRLVAERAVSEFGKIDVLVNNAGVASTTPSSRETAENFSWVVDVNLRGTFQMSQACVTAMAPGSSIVNVASVLGSVGPRYPQAAYASSKSGVLGLTRALAQEWTARKGVRVNALSPGYFRSEMTESALLNIEEMLRRHSIIPRMGRQSELNSALLFLVSEASTYMTGSEIVVDGGFSSV